MSIARTWSTTFDPDIASPEIPPSGAGPPFGLLLLSAGEWRALSSCRFSTVSSRKTGLSSPKTGHFQVTLWGFGDNGQFDSSFSGAPDSAACFTASHNGKRVYDPKSRQIAMLKYKG
ncbi:MAG: hypothetical protein EXS05_11495 [Planctomycetaceae bacterium]|nr:hypothetical protein [Planctomycetaceae bacterium]